MSDDRNNDFDDFQGFDGSNDFGDLNADGMHFSEEELEAAMAGFPCACIGSVTKEKSLTATCCGGEKVLDCDVAKLKKLWKDGLTPYY